jgi:hypothetical protein
LTCVVFVGPTLGTREVESVLPCDVRPPVTRGDLLHAALARPKAIGLIDGSFDRVPSVWHKEVLWALSVGIKVYGAASMGALRAAELGPFGMVGVGAIFNDYRNSVLEDDDEVAVAHATEEHSYRPLSDALVNIRATLRAAVAQGVIDEKLRNILLGIAKAIPFSDRTYSAVLANARAMDEVGESSLADLNEWLPTGRVDQKRLDGLEMLRRMRDDADVPHAGVDFAFSHTDAWESLWLDVAGRGPACLGTAGGLEDVVAEELLLRGEFGDAYVNALFRAAAQGLSERNSVRISGPAIEATIDEFRRERGLTHALDFERWLDAQGLHGVERSRFFEREAVVHASITSLQPGIGVAITEHLRSLGRLDAVIASAQRRRAIWKQQGLVEVGVADVHADPTDVWGAFFSRIGVEVPNDLEGYARAQRVSLDCLHEIALRSFLSDRMLSAKEGVDGGDS